MEPNAANAQRIDPYKNFKFRIRWKGRYVAGADFFRPPSLSPDVVKHREGGDPSIALKVRGAVQLSACMIEHGFTQDAAFREWAGVGSADLVPTSRDPQDLVIEFYDDGGRMMLAHTVFDCTAIEYSEAVALDAGPDAFLIQHIKLECERWERDRGPVGATEAAGDVA